jgi:hypothetical protein
MRIRRRLFTLLLLLPTAAISLCGQSDRDHLAAQLASPSASESPLTPILGNSRLPVRAPSPIAPISLPHMIHTSGAIFAGTVTTIKCSPVSNRNHVATVAVTFHVDRGIRGTVSGQDFTLRQWIGLWNGGQQRYRRGEKVLLFLYPPSKLGLTSWVGGSLGHFSFDSWGRVLLSTEHISAFRSDPVLGGKSTTSLEDFARAVQLAGTQAEIAERK